MSVSRCFKYIGGNLLREHIRRYLKTLFLVILHLDLPRCIVEINPHRFADRILFRRLLLHFIRRDDKVVDILVADLLNHAFGHVIELLWACHADLRQLCGDALQHL